MYNYDILVILVLIDDDYQELLSAEGALRCS